MRSSLRCVAAVIAIALGAAGAAGAADRTQRLDRAADARALPDANVVEPAAQSTLRDSSSSDDALVQQLDGTLAKVNASGRVLVGHRMASVPFSYVGPRGGDPIGYSIDICRTIVERMATQMGRELRIEWVPVTSDNRLQSLVDGRIDLECGSTTANAERSKTVSFSPTVFVSGTKLLVRKGSGIRSYRDLGGRTVVYTAGTTNEKAMREAFGKAGIDVKLVSAEDHEASYAMVADGRADAFGTDDVLLYGLIATHEARDRFEVIGEFLSYDPYGIMYRRNDPQMTTVVADAVHDMAQSRELEYAYNRWFTRALPSGQRLNLPMSAQLTEMFRVMGSDIH